MSKLENAAESYLQLADLTAEILEASPDGVVAVDPDGIIRYVNRTLCIRSGYHSVELLDKVIELLVPEALREIHRTQHRPGYALRPESRPMNPAAPLSMRHRSGVEIPVTIQLAPKLHPGGMLTVAVIRFPN